MTEQKTYITETKPWTTLTKTYERYESNQVSKNPKKISDRHCHIRIIKTKSKTLKIRKSICDGET